MTLPLQAGTRAAIDVRAADPLFESLPCPVAMFGLDLRFTRATSAFARSLGSPPAELEGASLPGLLGPHGARVQAAASEVLSTQATVSLPLPADAGRPSARATLFPVRDGAALIGVGLMLEPDAPLPAHEAELRTLVEQRETLIGVLAHELRTPLQAIAVSVALLGRLGQLTEGQQKAAARINSRLQHVQRILSDLLDYTRERAGGFIPLFARPMNLHAVCRRVLEEVTLLHPGRLLRWEEPEGEGWGEWDPDRVAQIVYNLLDNAVANSPRDAAIWVSVRDTTRGAELEVRNQGPAIADDVLRKLFIPFATASERGLGLGLFLVKSIAEAHGGTVEVRSNPVGGTAFTVVLPRKR